MRGAAVVLLLCTLLGTYAQPTQIVYQLGQTFVYSLTGTLDARGQDSSSGNPGSGTASTMVSTVAMKCTEVHPDYYVLVMNMFNTDVGVTGLDGSKAKNIKNNLGDDVYFQQLRTGEIPKVWYNTKDSQYYVQVKLGAINAFQTRIVNQGQGLTALENDPVGSHYSHFQGLSDPNVALAIHKTFNQAFPDPAVTSSDVQISALSIAGLHSAGFIQTSSVSQTVNYVNSAPGLKNVYGANGVMDMNLASAGQLTINYAPGLLRSLPTLEGSLTSAELSDSEEHFEKNLFEAARHMFELMQIETLFGVEEELEVIFAPSGSARPLARMDRVINILSKNPSAIGLELAPYFSSPLLLESKDFRDKLFYIASGVEGEAIDLMIKHALVSSDATLQLHALFATSKVRTPTPALLTVTRKLLSSSDSLVANAALMSLGRLLGSMGQPATELIERLHTPDLSPAETIATLYAIKNAGPKAAPKHLFTSNLLSGLVSHPHPEVRKVTQQVLGGHVIDTSKFLLGDDSDFPFNRSIGKNVTLGGSKVNGDFGAELFIGSNFNCAQQTFNYEALARANVELHLFGWSKEAFLAEVVYGKSNGMALADHVLVQVWNKVLYSQNLPQLDCSEHTKQIAHTEKGLSVSYTLWVSVIPVTFTAGGSLTLDLSWGWQVCDSDLSALVELIPGGSLTVYGNAEINLLILKAGLNLQGSFNTQIIPQAYVHGTQCQVGIDVRRVSVPMSITLDGYYAYKKCKLIIFDCKWGDHNEKVFASWNTPAINTVLLDQHWDIKL